MRNDVEVEVQYVEVNEKGEEDRSWRRRDVGMVVGLALWATAMTTDLYPTIERATPYCPVTRTKVD